MRLLIINELSCLRTKNENKEQERRKERKKRSPPSSLYCRGLFYRFFFAWYCSVLCVELLPEVLHLVMFFALFCQTTRKFSQVFKLFFKNIWREKKIVLPLHSLLRINVLDKLKKEFFEKIYINREVVQEARHIAICVLGRRNEPINSSNVNEGFKEWSLCFLPFCFVTFNLLFYY